MLRRGIRFSDGHPFDADVVVFSFRVYLDEKIGSPQRDLLLPGGVFARVQQLIAANLPVIYLATPNVLVGARTNLSNFQPAILEPYTL